MEHVFSYLLNSFDTLIRGITMPIVGYVRVSSVDQNTQRQLADIKLDKVFEEKCSAKTITRPIWEQCKIYCREGDTLMIHSLDRVCRSGAGDAVAIVEEMNDKGVAVEFIKEGMKFNGTMSAAQKGVLSILASVAQMERELIAERRNEGIAIARQNPNIKFGRPSSDVSKDDINTLLEQGISKVEVCSKLGISRASLYRILKK